MASFCSCCCGQRRRRNVTCRSPRFEREESKRDVDVRHSASTSVPVYYVKGSPVPVEYLRPGIDRDSRLFREKWRKAGARTQRPTSVNADVYMGNPCLLFLLNWQTIPLFTRLSLLRRTVQSRRVFSALPTISEDVSLEGGDAQQRRGAGRENKASSSGVQARVGMHFRARQRQSFDRGRRQELEDNNIVGKEE